MRLDCGGSGQLMKCIIGGHVGRLPAAAPKPSPGGCRGRTGPGSDPGQGPAEPTAHGREAELGVPDVPRLPANRSPRSPVKLRGGGRCSLFLLGIKDQVMFKPVSVSGYPSVTSYANPLVVSVCNSLEAGSTLCSIF